MSNTFAKIPLGTGLPLQMTHPLENGKTEEEPYKGVAGGLSFDVF